MKTSRFGLAGIVVFALTCIFACDPNAGLATRVSDADLATGRVTTAANQVLVISAVGDVRVSVGEGAQPEETDRLIKNADAGFRPADAGEFLLGTQTLKTGLSSSCDLQFGNAAVIHVNPQTDVKLEEINLRPGEVNVSLRTNSGELVCRVSPLSEKEKFRVQTPTAGCTSRGAEFAVSAIGDSITILGVKKGSVSCLPLGISLDQLQSRASRTNAALAQAVEQLAADTVTVGESRQVGVTSEQARSSAEALQLVTDELEKLAGQMTISVAERKQFADLALKTGTVLKGNLKFADSLGGAQKKLVDRIDGLRAVPLAVQTGFESKDSTASAAAASEKLARIFIKVSPSDADIDLNGDGQGQGAYRAILPAGRLFTFTFTSAGYTPKALPLTVDVDGKKSFEVILDKN